MEMPEVNRDTSRTFLALPLAHVFKDELSGFLNRIKNKLGDIRWVQAEQVHITLHFFGETTDEQIAKIKEAIRPLAASFSPVKICLKNIGFFPDEYRPKVIWIGLEGDVHPLKDLQKNIDRELQTLGFSVESRPFTPHATVGRVKGHPGKQRMNVHDFAKIKFSSTESKRIDHIVLFKSELSPDGPHYEILEQFPLSVLPTH